MTKLSPKKIVQNLDKFIIGQNKAKKLVAIAIRNRWRRKNIKSYIFWRRSKRFSRKKYIISKI